MKSFHGVLLIVILLALVTVAPSVRAQTFSVIHAFKESKDGLNPAYGLVRDKAGNLYGTTQYGGLPGCLYSCGTVFKVDASGNETTLHRFSGVPDGAMPLSGLILDAQGNLYGVTGGGGDGACSGGCGTVFKVDAKGNETVLHSFDDGNDGSGPQGGLVRDQQGNLYGTTFFGGNVKCEGYGCGTVFKVDATGKETVLYAFSGGTDGNFPAGGVIRDAAGRLFGTTSQGGAFDGGTVFELDTTGKLTVLHTFGSGTDGRAPYDALVKVGSSFYGTTAAGGTSSFGTVFKLDNSGQETVVYSFLGGADGASPYAGLVSDAAGNFYGTTAFGGTSSYGTVFKVDGAGNETILHTFTGNADGGVPYGGVIRDAAGNLYGTAYRGNPNNLFGKVFKIAP